MKTTARIWTGALLVLGALAGCGGSQADAGSGSQAAEGAGAQSAAATPDARQQAQQIFSTRCAACHGAEGNGDGPGAAGLDPKPRNYHDPEWQKSVTDEEIEQTIMYGGAAVGKSPLMVANPDLASKPEVVAALREIIRGFAEENN